MEKVAILAITKNGISIALSLKKQFPSWKIFAPSKFSNNDLQIEWFEDPTTAKTGELFKTNEALICIFSLGAVIRLSTSY
jgi:cobalt-precorrin 5A hydrolase